MEARELGSGSVAVVGGYSGHITIWRSERQVEMIPEKTGGICEPVSRGKLSRDRRNVSNYG